MTEFEIEYHVARLIAGGVSFRCEGKRYRLTPPDRFARLESAEVQMEAAREASLHGVPTHAELHAGLIARGIWSGEDQDRLDLLKGEIDELKVELYKARDDEAGLQLYREKLTRAKAENAELEARKHQLDHLGLETYARSARARHLTGSSLLHVDGTPYWPDRDEGWNAPDAVVEAAMARLAEDRLETAQIRSLARSDQWASVWNVRPEDGSPFDAAAVDLVDEQRILLSWSQAYENISRRPDGPPRAVVEDDDMLDGWILLERRKKDEDDLKSQFRAQVGDKVRNHDEVFLMMDPAAKEGTLRSSPSLLNTLNDQQALQIKNQRLAYVRSQGVVNEADMPDTALQNQAALMDMAVRKGRIV